MNLRFYHQWKRIFTLLILTFAGLLGPEAHAGRCDEVLRSVPVPGGTLVSFIEVKPNTASRSRGVVIMPPTGGISFLEKDYAQEICKNGARVTILDRWTADDVVSVNLGIHQLGFERAMAALNAVIGTFSKEQKISILGASVGGMAASLAISLYSRVDRALVIAAGGPFSEVIVHSEQKDLARVRKLRYQKYGFKNQKEYLAEMKKNFHLDPFLIPHKPTTKALGMIILGKDRSVPTLNQEKLFQLWQPDFVRRIDRPHIRGILEARFKYLEEIVQFVLSEDQ